MSSQHPASAFIEQISKQALESPAIHHPYLSALSQGALPDMEAALRDFAAQYGLYSSRFTQYVQSVIDQLNSPAHRGILQTNLAEEQGHAIEAELPTHILDHIEGRPHAELFRQFQVTVGAPQLSADQEPSSQPGALWSEQFLQLCKRGECTGIGALGIGTELVVSHIYNQILQALESHSQLSRQERIFFELHSHCDDEHAEQILLISLDLANDETACRQLEQGVTEALQLRTSFWDALYERALQYPQRNCKSGQRLATLEY